MQTGREPIVLCRLGIVWILFLATGPQLLASRVVKSANREFSHLANKPAASSLSKPGGHSHPRGKARIYMRRADS